MNNIAFKGGAVIAAIALMVGNTVLLAIGVLLIVLGLAIRYEDEHEEERVREFDGRFTKGGK